jgi:hypothetical protein
MQKQRLCLLVRATRVALHRPGEPQSHRVVHRRLARPRWRLRSTIGTIIAIGTSIVTSTSVTTTSAVITTGRSTITVRTTVITATVVITVATTTKLNLA